MTFRKFYEELKDIDIETEYKIYIKYTQQHQQLISLISELEASQNQNLDNLRQKYLPKKLTFDTVIKTAVISKNTRFINQSKIYKKVLKEYDKNHFIGYYTTNVTVKFYDEKDQSKKQYSLPKKGILIAQNKDIKIIENNSKRQKRSDTKYKDLKYLGDIEIENTYLIKKLYVNII